MHGRPGQPPRYESSFVGREREIADLLALLAAHRLVSICGVGGSGKTRLAVETSKRLSEVEPGSGATRVVWTSLATVREDNLVWEAIADELEIRGCSRPHSVAALGDALAAPPSLLVLDNCEQIVGGCGEVIAGLLASAPDVRILLTSRVPLHHAARAGLRDPGARLRRRGARPVRRPGRSDCPCLRGHGRQPRSDRRDLRPAGRPSAGRSTFSDWSRRG
jgi:hypothetical protein